ncbi:MAG: hypothetical protein COB53_03250 [Elusimicrobia bacterium]|nr:MAG: hypothetical protein COB53_03250 [Elusimicrobiota bacterium]
MLSWPNKSFTSLRKWSICAILGTLGISFPLNSEAIPYQRDKAVEYALTWWQTDTNLNLKCNRINRDKYRWYYEPSIIIKIADLFLDIEPPSDDCLSDSKIVCGTGMVGRDCTNFVSQALLEGGIKFGSPGGKPNPHAIGFNGTMVNVPALGAAVRSISTVAKSTFAAGAPAWLEPGDVVQWNNFHMTIVSSGNGTGARFSAHSCPRSTTTASLDFYFTGFGANSTGPIVATYYHINGLVTTASAETDPPTIVVKQPGGGTVGNPGYTTPGIISVEVTDNGSGISWFELARGAPIVNRSKEIFEGTGSLEYVDDNEYGTSHNYSIDLSSAPDGTKFYTQAFDKAGNATVATFSIVTTTPTTRIRQPPSFDFSMSSIAYTDTAVPEACSDAGMASLTISESSPTTSDFPQSFAFDGEDDCAEVGPIDLPTGSTYTFTWNDLAGNTTDQQVFSEEKRASFALCGDDGNGLKCAGFGFSCSDILDSSTILRIFMNSASPMDANELCDQARLSLDPNDCRCNSGGANDCTQTISDVDLISGSLAFAVTGSGVFTGSLQFQAQNFNPPGGKFLNVSFSNYNGNAEGNLWYKSCGRKYPKSDGDANDSADIDAPFEFVKIQSCQGDECPDFPGNADRQSLAPTGSAAIIEGSQFEFTSSTTLKFTYLDPGGTPAITTDTIKIYRFDTETGLWSDEFASNLWVEKSTTTNVIMASAGVRMSGYYMALFSVVDSSSPETSISVIGSTFIFNGSVFLSTDSLVVLTSTDPVVNGFHSGLKTISYRIDPESSDPWTTYTSSIPLTEGTHYVQYRAEDYTGNIETVQTSTYTVTAGETFKDTGGISAEAAVLLGFLDSGAQFEVEARTQNNYVLKASSADATSMTSIDNIGNWGIGTELANATIEIDRVDAENDIALQLRSGNSTGSLTSSQIALAYDGETSMRHLIKTQHYPSGADGNKIRFLIWSPTLGSTAIVSTSTMLSLESMTNSSGAVHIMPVVTVSSANLTVSDGTTLGGGSILVSNTVVPSSIEFKADVEALNEDAYHKAYNDVQALRHVNFRYKSAEGKASSMRRGLIYEDVSISIHGPGKSISFDQRLVNLEMSIHSAINKYENLLKRLRRVEEDQQ